MLQCNDVTDAVLQGKSMHGVWVPANNWHRQMKMRTSGNQSLSQANSCKQGKLLMCWLEFIK